jgi:Holliday junction DNA helicase RuvA
VISYIRGPLAEINEDMIVVEAGAVGYNIRVPLSVVEGLPGIGKEVKIYTYLQVREDAMSLYGFLTRQDLKMFRLLLGVSGIGPKGALGLLSAMRPDDLRLAVISGDVKAISRAPGIGNKTAQRLILDLKDKIPVDQLLSAPRVEPGREPADTGLGEAAREAVEALIALGYSPGEAARAVSKTTVTENMTGEDVLKASLRHLAF